MKRSHTEATLAVLLAAGMVLAGGAVVYFVSTISPVHSDPGAVPSVTAAVTGQIPSRAVEEARHAARALVVEENLPGLSVAVAQGGTLVWAEAFGWDDVEGRRPMTPRTKLRLGSVSKPLTAAAVGVLHERRRLDLEAPIQQYVPAFPKKPWPVTTRQLMGHVAGIRPPRWEDETLPSRHCASLDEALQIFGRDPLLFQPATGYRFSPYGWILVSAAIEAAAGEPFSSFMKREVFEPAGMEETSLDQTSGVPGLTKMYYPRAFERPDLGLQDVPRVDYSCWAGAGAFVSTPSDLARFGSAMLKPALLRAETIALLQTPLRLESGASTGYALGWKVETVSLAGTPTRLVSHRGAPVGGTVSLLTFPDLGLVVAAASNVSFADEMLPFTLRVAEAFAKPAKQPTP